MGENAECPPTENQVVESAARLASRLHMDLFKNSLVSVVLDDFTKQVVKLLARYWCDNPFACDTVEGIRQWWLTPVDDISVGQVNRALAWLHDCGLVERFLAADGRARFRRASSHDDAVLRQLAEFGELGKAQSQEIH